MKLIPFFYRNIFIVNVGFKFIWIFISILGFDYWGVWYGTAVSVMFGSSLSLAVAYKVSKSEIGGIKITN